MPERIAGREYRTSFICIDSFADSIPCGRIYNPYIPNGESFRGTIDMLIRLENLFDSMNYPQSYNILRGFSAVGNTEDAVPASGEEKRGRLATFSIRVLFRQNASWQGSVSWLEGSAEESFRSVLELLFLMNSALKEESNNG